LLETQSGRFCRGFHRSVSTSIEFLLKERSVVTIEARDCAHSGDQDLMLGFACMPPNHAWKQISWLCDIVQLARSRALDWVALQAKAESLGITRIVAVTFLLADKLLGTGLPRSSWSSETQAQPRGSGATHRGPDRGGRRIRPGIDGPIYRLMMELRERTRGSVISVLGARLVSYSGQQESGRSCDCLALCSRCIA